jgi:hypothetical protein
MTYERIAIQMFGRDAGSSVNEANGGCATQSLMSNRRAGRSGGVGNIVLASNSRRVAASQRTDAVCIS